MNGIRIIDCVIATGEHMTGEWTHDGEARPVTVVSLNQAGEMRTQSYGGHLAAEVAVSLGTLSERVAC